MDLKESKCHGPRATSKPEDQKPHTHKDSRSHNSQELCDPKHLQMASQTPHRAARAEGLTAPK